MTQTAQKETKVQLSPRENFTQVMESRKPEFKRLLPNNISVDRFIKTATVAVVTNPVLLECELASVVTSIGLCAQIGLELNTPLGHAYLVPFNSKKKDANGKDVWIKKAQAIIGYRGLIELALRSGEVVSIGAHEIRENDEFDFEYGLEPKLKHKIDIRKERGQVVGFYASAKLKQGEPVFEVMSKMEVDEIMLGSQSKGQYGPWKDNYTEMGRKTLIRRLSKYLPLSIEFQMAVAADAQADAGTQTIESVDGEYIVVHDNTINEKAVKSEITMPSSKKSTATKNEEKVVEQVKEEKVELVSAEQVQILISVLHDSNVEERAFEEEYGYKLNELPANMFEGVVKNIAELIAQP